jgi:hypothetical protein
MSIFKSSSDYHVFGVKRLTQKIKISEDDAAKNILTIFDFNFSVL